MLPMSLAPYGYYSIIGWGISGIGATCLSLVFAGLCYRFPKTGGPHVYVKEIFGSKISFFTGWTYWIISWVSTTAVVIASIGYLSPYIGNQSAITYLILEIILLFTITCLNLKGVQAAGKAEFILTLLKIIPLILLPVIALFYFKSSNFIVQNNLNFSSSIAQVTILTLWGFIGLETATTSAGSVNNPAKTIPKAVIFGTLCTALIYLINSVGIMGLMPGVILKLSKAPYIDATHYLFGGNWHFIISGIAAIICIGTLNAWMLASGQIALGLAEDGLLPKIFLKKNKNGAPLYGLVTSCLGIMPFLFLMMSHSVAKQLSTIIDFSVVAFLFIYLICALAFFIVLWREKAKFYHWIYTLIAIIFCCWIIWETRLTVIFTSLAFTFSGIPIFFFWYLRKNIIK